MLRDALTRALLARRTGDVLCLRRTFEPPNILFTDRGAQDVHASACPRVRVQSGTRRLRKLLERGSTLTAYFTSSGTKDEADRVAGRFFIYDLAIGQSRILRGKMLWRISAS